jgi:hypothetical protein
LRYQFRFIPYHSTGRLCVYDCTGGSNKKQDQKRDSFHHKNLHEVKRIVTGKATQQRVSFKGNVLAGFIAG